MFMQHFISSTNDSNQSASSMAKKTSLNCSDIKPNYPMSKPPDLIFPWKSQSILNIYTPKNNLPFPPYWRSVSAIFPETTECHQQCKIPLGIIVNPASVSNTPIIDYYKNLDFIPHCSSCSSYLCPQCKTMNMNGLRSWSCAICGKANVFPTITNSSLTIPFDDLIELSDQVYDIIAPSRYYDMNSQSAFAFIIDMTYNAFSTGFTRQFLTTIQKLVEDIPMNSRVCILTISNTLSIFNLKKFQEIVISDLSEMSLTANQSSLFPPLSECKQYFLKAIQVLLSRVPSNTTSGNCLLSAIVITEIIMKGIGGIIVANCVNLPTEGPFGLKYRTGNNENELLQLPDNDVGHAYQEEAIRLNISGISVHLFCSNKANDIPAYCDITTISILSRFTNGKCHFYGSFDENQRKQLNIDLFESIFSQHFWESRLRINHSYGLKISKIYSNCILQNNNTLSFPVLSKDTTIIFEFDIVKPIIQQQVLFQLALYFSTNEGERVIRVFTFELPKSNDYQIVCASVNEDALITVLTRKAILRSLSEGPQAAFYNVKNDIHQISTNCKKFPSFLYLANSILCSQILSNFHPLGVDGRMAILAELNSLPIVETLTFLYPRLIVINGNNFECLPLRKSSIVNGSCFIFHCYKKIYFYVKNGADPTYLKNAFGVDSIDQITSEIPVIESNENKVIKKLLDECCEVSGRHLQIEIICQGSQNESKFDPFFVDDNQNLDDLVKELNL